MARRLGFVEDGRFDVREGWTPTICCIPPRPLSIRLTSSTIPI